MSATAHAASVNQLPPAAGPLVRAAFDDAILAAALAIANAGRILRRLAPVARLDELPTAVQMECYASAMAAVLEQVPAARHDALNDAGEEIRQFFDQLTTDLDYVLVANDPQLLKAACVAIAKKVLFETYRGGLAAQLPILRSPEGTA